MYKDSAGKTYPPFDQLAALNGDAKAGAAVFRGEKAGCIRCHQIGDEGGKIGPPLTTVGEKLSRAQLVEAVFDPSAAILMGFENWIVRTKDGNVLTGLKVEDAEDHITLLDVHGKYTDIKTEDIKSKKQDTKSIMPDGLPAAVTQKEMVDLLTYLSTLKY